MPGSLVLSLFLDLSFLFFLSFFPYHTEDSPSYQINELLSSLEANQGLDLSSLPPVYFIVDHIPTSLLPSLYDRMDAVVIPSRGEGWGRPHVEAMAMGLPLIATNWSGPTEYSSPSPSLPSS